MSPHNVESLAERWERLDRETLAEAHETVKSSRRFHRHDFARAPLAFLRTFVVKHSFLDGTPGLIRAGMNAIHTFVTHLRIWAIENDAEREGEPHEDSPP